MSSSLKHKAAKGFFWSLLEKLIIRGGQFTTGIILARILTPNDFGTVAMLSFFIVVSYVLIDSGLGKGLVQQQDCSGLDFSTVFVFNCIVSVGLYLVIFLCAPFVAYFYDTPELVYLVRVLAFSIVLQALTVVQNAKLTIDVDFKRLAQINVYSMVGGGAVAIGAALCGLGVWALVFQTITRSLINMCLHWYFGNWSFSLRFSIVSFKRLFKFGSNLLIAGIISETANNIYNLIIGKFYLTSELGEYNRSKSFTNLTSDTITQAIQQVTFPLLSSLQYEKDRIKEAFKRVVKMSAFFSFPLMTLLSLLAEPLVLVLLTDKWLMVVPLLKWMAFSRIFYSISSVNLNVLNAIGRSDLFLKVDLFKFSYLIIVMTITIPMGVEVMVIGQVLNSFLAYFVNTFLPGKYYRYGFIKQIKDLRLIIIATILMAVVVFMFVYIVESKFISLLLGGSIGILVYYMVCKLLKVKELTEIEYLFLTKLNIS